MGIAGLLPLLKEIQQETHVEKYRGKTVGIDAYVWLHRGAYSCASELALGKPTTRYIAYAVHRIRMLKHYGVTPYVVFDGDRLPSKQGTEMDRSAKRAENRAKALAFLDRNQMAAAREAFTRCVDVTPAMAFELIKVLRSEKIPYVVAPYEADAQLAFLERHNLIDAIITEDSDLLVYGCKTVLFKLDTYGQCIEIQQCNLPQTTQISLKGWGVDEFRRMAILSGCDYLPSIVGMGLKSAYRYLQRYSSVEKVLQAIRLEGKLHVPLTYADDFRRAEFTFMHQRVWDPRPSGCLATLTPLPSDVDQSLLPYIGAMIPLELAREIARGDVCPISKQPWDTDRCRRSPNVLARSISTPVRSSMKSAHTPFRSASRQATSSESKGTQSSLHTFFAKKPPADVSPGTPRRKVLGELDPNQLQACSKSTYGSPMPDSRNRIASRFFTPNKNAREAPISSDMPTVVATPLKDMQSTHTASLLPTTQAVDQEENSDGIHTPTTSPRHEPNAETLACDKSVDDHISSPISPEVSPDRAQTSKASHFDHDELQDGFSPHSQWIQQFRYPNSAKTSLHWRSVRTPCRALSDTTPTRASNHSEWTRSLPIKQHTQRTSMQSEPRTSPIPTLRCEPRHVSAAAHESLPDTSYLRASPCLDENAIPTCASLQSFSHKADQTPSPMPSGLGKRTTSSNELSFTPTHTKRTQLDTSLPTIGNTKLLQFRYKGT
ncbi:hypothetical protein MYAM1_003348 [Malassezia yamatoensis]|uniref:Exonuclease 1 n=1 Tax=Malassezia yamatoensis TaxID=253288 RepID=A0AAJ5YXL7_9BASI|nr:hypothetical protein MYAM1_003348 [Malassezia yamatoensis]